MRYIRGCWDCCCHAQTLSVACIPWWHAPEWGSTGWCGVLPPWLASICSDSAGAVRGMTLYTKCCYLCVSFGVLLLHGVYWVLTVCTSQE